MSQFEGRHSSGKAHFVKEVEQFLNKERPSLAALDPFNPLRIPETDRRSEQIIHELSGGASKGASAKLSTNNGAQPAAASEVGLDPSLRGIFVTFKRLVKFGIETSKGLAAVSFGLGCVAAMQGLGTGLFVSLVQNNTKPTIVGAAIMVAVGCAAIATICIAQWSGDQVNNRLGWKIATFLDRKFHTSLVGQSYSTLDEPEFHLTLAEVKQHRFRLNHLLYSLSGGVAGGLGVALCAAAYFQHFPLLAVAAAAAIVPRLVVDFMLAPSIDKREKEQAKRFKKIEASSDLLQEIEAVREMKQHDREAWALNRVERLMEASTTGRTRIINDTAWRQLFGSAPLLLAGTMATAAPIMGYFSKTFAGNDLASAVGAAIGLTTSAFMVAALWGQILSQRIFIQRVLNFFDQAKPTADDGNHSTEVGFASSLNSKFATPTIEFTDVVVRVPLREEPILTIESLTLTPGEVVGVVGEKGQGKTTMLRLLMKEIEPTSGTITVSNFKDAAGTLHKSIDLASIPVKQWHALVSKLYQDYPKFEGMTVSDASHLGSRREDDSALKRARDVVKLNEILPEGSLSEEVFIGAQDENGIRFSGGQIQAIAVLRALAFDEKPILLLDEPGAHADPTFETHMLSEIKKANREAGKLTIIVSHRYGSLTDADRIIVLNNHTIEKIGTHGQLMRHSPTYRKAMKLQLAALLPEFDVDIDSSGTPAFKPKVTALDPVPAPANAVVLGDTFTAFKSN